ncbi:unnamed protein product [Symbiodinium sp. CCMP2456]|nr:unnamed protein product [Symbiodinium sp. CCMP2456]
MQCSCTARHGPAAETAEVEILNLCSRTKIELFKDFLQRELESLGYRLNTRYAALQKRIKADDLETDGKSPGLAGQPEECSDGAVQSEQMWPLQAVFSGSVFFFESMAGMLPWTCTEHVHTDATYTEAYDVLTQPLLEFLEVQDLVHMRAASSAESFDEAVSLHVEKAAGFEPSEFAGSAMISCRNFLCNLRATGRGSGETSLDCGKRLLRTEFGDNLAPQKSQLCRVWLVLQASEEHFRDSRGMTNRFLKHFVTRCCDEDPEVSMSVHYLLKCCGKTGLEHVQRQIAEEMFKLTTRFQTSG